MEIYWFVLAGIILGIFGQLTRTVVGIKKQYDATTTKGNSVPSTESPQSAINKISTFWNNKQFLTSLLTGAIAGVLGSILLYGLDMNIGSADFMLAVIASGYAGSDFIEGLARTKAPKVTTEEIKVVEEEKKKLRTETIDNLKELYEFKKEGLLTEEEFNDLKQKYLKSLLTTDEEKLKELKIVQELGKAGQI